MAICFICLEACVPNQFRAIVTLICGHLFHLVCIGCEFNSKGVMECPVCRKRENSEWRFCWGDPSRPRLGVNDESDEITGDDEVSDELTVSGCSVEGCDCTGSLSRRQSHHQPQQQEPESESESESEFESEPESEEEVQFFRPVSWLRPLTSAETWRLWAATNAAEGSSSSQTPPVQRPSQIEVQGRGYEMYSIARRIGIGSIVPPPLRAPFRRPDISLSVLINPVVPRNFPGQAEAMGRNASAAQTKDGEEEL